MEQYTNLLDVFKAYPLEFAQTAYVRSQTTPNPYNKEKHLELRKALIEQDWDTVTSLLLNTRYRSALQGVVICTNSYTDLDCEIVGIAYDLLQEGKMFPDTIRPQLWEDIEESQIDPEDD